MYEAQETAGGAKRFAGRSNRDRQQTWITYALLVPTLLAALWLRVYRLGEIPLGVDYDEAGNFILAQEIAAGQSQPVFIRAYAGREAVFYWLAAASMWLLGRTLFAFRLAAALCGVGTVLFAYLLAREMFHDAPSPERAWVPIIGAALAAVSYWHVHVSRYGFRVNAMTFLLAATMTFLWRGLRRDSQVHLVVSGLLCGLAANTYLAVRAFPAVLLVFALWTILAWRPAGGTDGRWRWTRLRQWALFAGAALLALAPLAVFFLQNPQFFGTRMGQVSVFDPAIHGGDLWGTLGQVALDALGIFTVRGDSNPVYNYDQRPIFGPALGGTFYLGLAVCLWRLFSPGRRLGLPKRTPYLLILAWLPVMLIPNILGARGVPHSLRSLGMAPVVYVVPALGVLALIRGAAALGAGASRGVREGQLGAPENRRASWTPTRLGQRIGPWLVLVLLVAGGAQTYRWYFSLWTQDPEAYYRSAADVRLAAEYLGQWDPDEVTLFASNDTYRHTTIAAFCANYQRLKWISGATLVVPGAEDRPTLYVFDHTNPLDPVLARYIPPETLQHRQLGPDGRVGFEAYLVAPEQRPPISPQVQVEANLGGLLAFVGYDLNADAAAGDVLDVTLYLQALRDGDRDDWTFFAHLVDDLGFRWGGETFFHYPSIQWKAGDVMLFRQRIAIAAGAPPGAYTLDVGAFSPSLDARLPVLNAQGQMAGTAAHVGPIPLAQPAALPDALPPIQQPLDAPIGPALALLGFDRDRGDLRPGETLALSLYWQSDAPVVVDYAVALWLQAGGQRIPLWTGYPAHGSYPFSRWPSPTFLRDRYALRLPTDAPAGDWELRLALLQPDGAPLPLAGGSSSLSLGTFHVHATDRLWEPPAFAFPVGARLGDVVELLGYDLDRQQARPGETVRLTLVWRCLGEMDTPYTVFTHLLDEGEQVRGQQDNPPVGGTYPTTLWVPGEVMVDAYEIAVQEGAPPGTYVLEVGMYDPATVQRLPVLDPSGTMGDRVLLGEIQVTRNQ